MLLFYLFGPRGSVWHMIVDTASNLYDSYSEERQRRQASAEAQEVYERELRWVMATFWHDQFETSKSTVGANNYNRVMQLERIQQYIEAVLAEKHLRSTVRSRSRLRKLEADLRRMKIDINQLRAKIVESEQNMRVVPLP